MEINYELGTKENPHPIIPKSKDRVKKQYYIYKNELRYWTGSKLINKEKIKAKNKKWRENNKEKRKEYLENNKEKIKEKQKEYRENNKEKIKKIQKEYREKNKEKGKRNQKEYYKNNKEKIKKIQKEYFEKNKVKIKAKKKEWRENNKEKRKEYLEKNKVKIKAKKKEWYEKNKHKNKSQKKEYQREYRKNNKEKLYEQKKEYNKKRRKNDPLYRLVGNIRHRVWTALKSQKAYKNQRTMEYVNCSVAQLHNHLESQFKDSGMNWDNMGREDGEGGRGWEIDHRRPCASFDLNDEEQKYMCFHWTNLQPMWGQENREKLNKFDPKTFRYKWIDRETGWVGIPRYLMNK